MSGNKGKIGIVGSGLIGSCWATLFASAGYPVCLYDISEEQLEKSKQNIKRNLDNLQEKHLLRGVLSAEQSLQLVSGTVDLKKALEDCIYVQESTCETLEFKTKIFQEMDQYLSEKCIVGSSTSTIPASKFTEKMRNRERCLVVHPINPPILLRLVELVPAPWTTEASLNTAYEIMKAIGQKPVRLRREVLGFAVNRIQYAILAEAWRLVNDGTLSVEDVDTVMTAGLGPRFALNGPFQTIHLNANGVADYCARYAGGMRNVLADFGPTPSFEEKKVLDELSQSLNTQMPLNSLEQFKTKRENQLAEIAKLKK